MGARLPKKLLPIFAYNMTAYADAAVRAGATHAALARAANMTKSHWSELIKGIFRTRQSGLPCALPKSCACLYL